MFFCQSLEESNDDGCDAIGRVGILALIMLMIVQQ